MGRAMSEGGIGDTVTVQNPASFRMITAIVTAAGTVAPPARPRPCRQPTSPPANRICPCTSPVSRFSAVLLLGAAPWRAARAVDRIENIGEAPKLAPVGNPADTQIVAAIPQPPPISHAGNSLWQPGANSFFHDPRASHVGDVITVNVSVADAAKLSNTHLALAHQFRRRQSDQFLRPGKRAAQEHRSQQPGQDGLGHFQCRRRLGQPLGKHQHDPGGSGRPGAAQRQSGDRRPSAGAGQQRAARHAGLRHRAHAKTSPRTTPSISPRSPKRASPMAARARSAMCSSRVMAAQLFDILMPW